MRVHHRAPLPCSNLPRADAHNACAFLQPTVDAPAHNMRSYLSGFGRAGR